MNLREAAEAALKAMSSFESGTNGLYEGEFAEEIAVLRAALAEPVQEPVQEPVGVLRTLVRIHPDGTETWREEPLWIAPPQRKPLTDEEIAAAANSVKWSQQYHVDYARAIERAHVIGGDA